MPLTAFDHVNIRTGNLDALVGWYADILGLRTGFRPDFPFPGAWLYLGDQAIIHLVGTDHDPSPFSEDEDLRMEHVSFRATGFAEFKAKLEDRSIPHRITELDEVGLALVNIRDPDGNHLHIDFDLKEGASE